MTRPSKDAPRFVLRGPVKAGPYAPQRTPRIDLPSDEGIRKEGTTLNVDLIFKIAAIGILVAVLNQVLSRSGREEQATMVTLTGLVVVLMMVVQQISELFTLVKELFGL